MTSERPSETQSGDLGRKPEPEIEPREPNPGGVDAIEQDDAPPAVHDLDPSDNPAIEDEALDEISEPEDTETEKTESDDGEDVDDTQESSG